MSEEANGGLARRVFIGGLALVGPLGWVLQALGSDRPELVEAWFARGLFPAVRRAQEALVGWVPFSLAEAGLVLAAAVVLGRAVFLVRSLWRRQRNLRQAGGRAGLELWLATSCLYALFLLTWGFNYAREPLSRQLGIETQPATRVELAQLVGRLAERANAAREECADPLVDALADSAVWSQRVSSAFARAAERYPSFAGPDVRIRRPLLSHVLSQAGIAGIYSPFSGEPHVNADLPRPSFAFTACHEAAHARGIAREDEANAVAFLVCQTSSDPEFRYSGYLAAFDYALGALVPHDPSAVQELLGRLSPAVQADRERVREFWRAFSSPVRKLARATNDLYLRTQGTSDGVHSYGRMVDLLLALER